MEDQTLHKQKEHIKRKKSKSEEAALYFIIAVANLVVAAIFIVGYGLTQSIEINPFMAFSLATTTFFAIMGLLIYLEKEKLADIVFDAGAIAIVIITIAVMFNAVMVYNKIIENNSDKFLELASKYEQCIDKRHSVKDIASQVLNWYDHAFGLSSFISGIDVSKDPRVSSCKPLLEEIKEDPVIKELYNIKISRKLALVFWILFLISYISSNRIAAISQAKLQKNTP